jgi:DNA repair exonuclease SbcCD ATPase subunit
MRILQFSAENFKRIRIVEIVPTKRVTTITGKNGQGKTSVLDALWALFAGKRGIPEKPVRRGADKSRLRAVVGDDDGKPLLIATRTIASDRTTNLTVEAAPGAEAIAGTPQAVLDMLIGQMSFDPIAFIHADAKAQVEILRGLVKVEIDIDEENRQIEKEYAERTDLKKQAKALEAQVNAIAFSPNLPKEPIDEAEILGRIEKAGEHNKNLEGIFRTKRALADALATQTKAIADNEATIKEQREKIPTLERDVPIAEELAIVAAGHSASYEVLVKTMSETLPGIDLSLFHGAQIVLFDYAADLEPRAERLARDLDKAKETLEAAVGIHTALLTNEAIAKQAFEEAPAGELVDTQPMLVELQRAQGINREIARRTQREKLEAELRETNGAATARTRSIDDREEKKRTALASAKMPIDGLTFDEQGVFFRQVPILQLGEAEQIRVGVALAMASNPKLRAVPIAHGESLDDDSLALIETMAEENNFQIFMARVDSSGKVGIVLSDGKVESVNE